MTGKQLQIAMVYEDELAFQDFLKREADVVFIESFAPTREDLFTSAFKKEFETHQKYNIWNKAFPWEPEYGHVNKTPPGSERFGWHYIANAGAAPFIEFSRTSMADVLGFGRGRIYWAKTFSAPDGVIYDLEQFAKWYNKVANWIKKNAAGKVDIGDINVYFLPGAWAVYELKKE